MDDALYGQRDKRDNWKPFKRVEYPAVFIWPAQPRGILKWLFSYPSALIHTEGAGIVANLSRMASAERVQVKGLGA